MEVSEVRPLNRSVRWWRGGISASGHGGGQGSRFRVQYAREFLLGGSWVVKSILTLLITPLITTHEPPSRGYGGKPETYALPHPAP